MEDDALSGLGVTVGGRCWRLQESHHSQVAKRTSRPEWCLAVVSWRIGVDVGPCEQYFHYPL